MTSDPLVTTMVVAVAAVVAGVGAINVVQVFFVRDTLSASTTVFGLACVPPVRRAVRSEPPADAVPRSAVLAGDSVGA